MIPHRYEAARSPDALVPHDIPCLPSSLRPITVQLSRECILWLPQDVSADVAAEIANHQVGQWVEVGVDDGQLRLDEGGITNFIGMKSSSAGARATTALTIATAVKSARRSHGMTQEDLGALCGVTGEFVGRIERMTSSSRRRCARME